MRDRTLVLSTFDTEATLSELGGIAEADVMSHEALNDAAG